MLGDKERQLLARLNDAEESLRSARRLAIAWRVDDVAVELRIVLSALDAAKQGLKDDLPEYKHDQ